MKTNCKKKGPAENTLTKWIWFYIEEVRELESMVIVWEHRKTNDVGGDALASVDTTDVKFQQMLIPDPNKPGKTMRNKALYSFKTNSAALRYEIAVSILSNDVVWINGPFFPGDWTDLLIFCYQLKQELEVGEKVEADDIYIGEAPAHVICAASCTTQEEQLKIHKRIEGRHEALNKHVKNWGCLKKNICWKGYTS